MGVTIEGVIKRNDVEHRMQKKYDDDTHLRTSGNKDWAIGKFG
jgi:hypothetical protein